VQRRDPELAGAHILSKPFTAAELDALLAQVSPTHPPSPA
jgi:hypothetical protein